MHDEILKKVVPIIREKMSVKGEILESQRFVEDFSADSLDLWFLVEAMQKEFSIQVPDEDFSKLVTVGDAVSYIEGKLAP
ncbi:MAG: acyl carrier protein [Coprothermobacterota bacterium]|jgi:acyl carrier protein|nr:acyl carrier protein [Coprothermobacterota bacterium]